MILATGSTGKIGCALVERLASSGVPVRVLSRNPINVKPPVGPVEVVGGDLDDPESIEQALEGVSTLFALAPGPDIPAQEANMVNAALRRGVEHVVLMSSLGVELGGIGSGAMHLRGEALLRESGLPHTILHPTEFMTNSLWWRQSIESSSAIFVPSGSGRIAFIDPIDVGEVAAHVLSATDHGGRVYRLTGPEAMTTADIAAQLTGVLGRTIQHVDIPEEDFRAQMVGFGMPLPMVEMQMTYYAAVKAGRADVITQDVEELLGRPPGTYRSWLERHTPAFQ